MTPSQPQPSGDHAAGPQGDPCWIEPSQVFPSLRMGPSSKLGSDALIWEFGVEIPFLVHRSSLLDMSTEAREAWGCGANVTTHIETVTAALPRKSKQNYASEAGRGQGQRGPGNSQKCGAVRGARRKQFPGELSLSLLWQIYSWKIFKTSAPPLGSSNIIY